jgi:hypothetical protein
MGVGAATVASGPLLLTERGRMHFIVERLCLCNTRMWVAGYQADVVPGSGQCATGLAPPGSTGPGVPRALLYIICLREPEGWMYSSRKKPWLPGLHSALSSGHLARELVLHRF